MCGRTQDLDLGLYHLDTITSPSKILGLMDPNLCFDSATADYLWRVLRHALQQIQRKHISNLTFEELYRHSYYLVLHKHGGLLYSGLQQVIAEHITSQVQPHVLGNLNENFLPTMNNCWTHHLASLVMIRDVLMYLDRVYVHQHTIDDIYTVGLDLFKQLVVQFEHIQSYLQTTLLDLVLGERQGHCMDRPVFRSATTMLMALGNGSPTVYKENFETNFLQQSADFFKVESLQLLEENDASLYLKRVESRIREEVDRSQCCFDKMTTPQVVRVLEDELISVHMGAVVEMNSSGLVHMMENQQTDDLACMYKLLGRVPKGLKTMFECISNHLREQGQVLVRDENTNNNALIYVQNLLDLKEKIDFYLINSFSNDKLCKQAIASDFEYILNLNSRSPEYLSLFIDEKLKKTIKGMTDDDRVLLLDKTIVLFRFLQDKDLFEQYYKQHLAKRLLVSKGVNIANEKGVIVKFKSECGLQYTRKMEGMFRDIWASTSITEEFHKSVEVTGDPVHGVEMSVRVLTAVYWPAQASPVLCSLPIAPLTAFESFKKFYLSRHCGRQLSLLPHLGSAELEASFAHPLAHCEDGEGRHSYVLHVSTYQMCVLMLFNDHPRWTFQELQMETNLVSRDLLRALQSLINGKPSQRVLIKQPDSRKINISDNFRINAAFSSKTYRVKIPPFQVKYDTESERQDTLKRVNEDRNHEIEAAIIRVLKAKRVLNSEMLILEVTNTLSPRFVPSKDTIKTRIEVLIEREYIARNPEDRRVFEYIA